VRGVAHAAGSDWFIRTRRRRRIAQQIFDAEVEEPAALLLFRV
jgi:hypothetical protein